MKALTKYIRVVVDTNDADYAETFCPISDEAIAKIFPVIQAIKAFTPYEGEWSPGNFMFHDNNYPSGECCREDMGEKPAETLYGHLEGFQAFDDLLPYSEYGFHTIKSIELMEVSEVEDLL